VERARAASCSRGDAREPGGVHGSGIWRAGLDERARYALVYLLNQNGEAGVTCSTACTDGLARALRELGSDARSRAVVERLERATPESWIHGAQFVTEIQGGSDAATNALRAAPAADGLYALSGKCSAPTRRPTTGSSRRGSTAHRRGRGA
jgi:alkylation response protein AidB-like acyl-CoA dehydrogenase